MRQQSILQSRFTKFENSWKALNPTDHILRSLKRTSFQVAFAYPFVFLARQISPLSVCLSVCLPVIPFPSPSFRRFSLSCIQKWRINRVVEEGTKAPQRDFMTHNTHLFEAPVRFIARHIPCI